jgi:hypothetical protein
MVGNCKGATAEGDCKGVTTEGDHKGPSVVGNNGGVTTVGDCEGATVVGDHEGATMEGNFEWVTVEGDRKSWIAGVLHHSGLVFSHSVRQALVLASCTFICALSCVLKHAISAIICCIIFMSRDSSYGVIGDFIAGWSAILDTYDRYQISGTIWYLSRSNSDGVP